jgi:GTPase SAR1 family protein
MQDKAKEFNIVLIGDGGVGKTSYVKRFVSPEYDKENQMPTEKVEVHPLMLEKRTEGEAAVQGQEVASGSKKLTPGEIRIQKGTFMLLI